MKYNVLYKDVEIGVLEINAVGQHKYTPNYEGVSQIKDEVSLIREMLVASDWRNPIPFFSERIENAQKFNLRVIRYQTDFFKMVRSDNE